MTHPIPQAAHPGVHGEFATLVRRHHTAASLAAAGGEWMPDVSEFNGTVDMGAVKRAGAAGVIIRSSFGTARADHRWEANRANADAARLPWLAYHVAYPAYNTAAAEGAFANAVVGPLQPGRGQAGDFENDPGALAWPGGQQAHNWAAGFLTALGPSDYIPPWYCSTSFVGPHALGPLAATWPWWEAAYGVSAPDELGLAPVMWQQTDRASVAGISGPCDVSIMLRGSFASLLYGGDPMDQVLAARLSAFLDSFSGNVVAGAPASVQVAQLSSLWNFFFYGGDNSVNGVPFVVAMLSALRGDDDQLVQLTTAQGQALTAAQSSVTALAAKFDAVLAGLPPDEAAGIKAELQILGKHVGVDVTTGADT